MSTQNSKSQAPPSLMISLRCPNVRMQLEILVCAVYWNFTKPFDQLQHCQSVHDIRMQDRLIWSAAFTEPIGKVSLYGRCTCMQAGSALKIYMDIQRTLIMALPGFIWGTAFCARDIMPTMLTRNVFSSRSRGISVKSSTALPCTQSSSSVDEALLPIKPFCKACSKAKSCDSSTCNVKSQARPEAQMFRYCKGIDI